MFLIARLLLPALLATACPAQDPALEAARRVFEDPQLQRELPVPGAGDSAKGGDSGKGESRTAEDESGGAPDDAEGFQFSLPSEPVDGLLRALGWILIGAFGLFLLVHIASLWSQRTRNAALERPKPKPASADSTAAELDAADPAQLASAGRYAEALHSLYLQVLEHLARDVQPSATSRELIRRLKLEPAQRAAFRGLSRRVENAIFGGHSVEEADWREGLELAQNLSSSKRKTSS